MYEYTKPRAPIAAMFGSPGPCYGLPNLCGYVSHDPRSVHLRYPAWQFGIKHGKFVQDSSPGPVHYPDVQYTRTGRNGCPHYSIYGRPKDLSMFKTPGPGKYSPQNAGPSASPTAPSFSFGGRTRLRANDQNPSPNSYTLPRLLGNTVEGNKRAAPCFSQKGRSKVGGFDEDLQRTPGPGTYGSIDPNIYRDRSPSYTMRPLASMPGDSTLKPGPGAHSPERVNINRRVSPSHSFGIRHSNYVTPLILDVSD